MTLNKAGHVVEEIEGIRCSIAEKDCSNERAAFLKQLLELNGYEVKIKKDEKTGSLVVGVTDVVFNPVLSVYGRCLKSPSGKRVTPAYWLQKSDKETEAEVNYWTFKS